MTAGVECSRKPRWRMPAVSAMLAVSPALGSAEAAPVKVTLEDPNLA
jgi:hypothetical protein